METCQVEMPHCIQELPPHGKNASYMFDTTKFTNNSFLSFQPLFFIHWRCSATNNIGHLCNKTLINLQPLPVDFNQNGIKKNKL